jgi:hypothetical protein
MGRFSFKELPMRSSFLGFLLLFPLSLLAQPAPVSGEVAAAAVSGAMPSAPTSPPSEAAAAPSLPASPASQEIVIPGVVQGPGDLAVEGVPVMEAVDFYKKSKAVLDGPTILGIVAALGSLVALLIALLRRYGNKLMTQKSVNKAGLALAAVAGGLGGVTPQMPWWGACLVVLAPLAATLGPGDHASRKG